MPSAEDNQLIADSTFFLCFLEDIENPGVLTKILQAFDIYLTPLVHKEVSKSNNFKRIQSSPKLIFLTNEYLGEALRPFFSKKQIEKGETEVIELAYDFYVNRTPKMFILDDKQPRMFVLKHLSYLKELMTGTVGFVGQCCFEYEVFDKEETLEIIALISMSDFRVSADVISEVLFKIESRYKNGFKCKN